MFNINNNLNNSVIIPNNTRDLVKMSNTSTDPSAAVGSNGSGVAASNSNTNGYFVNTNTTNNDSDDLLNINNTIPPQVLENNNSSTYQDPNYLALALTNDNNNTKPKKKSSKHHTKSKPAFVMKLWTMVNDPNNHDLITWFHDGLSFLVTNRELFVQKILPKYFKHSNFASFVRQLNMYGWHKVQDANSGSLHSDEKWQFINPNFQQGKPELLDKIVRNKTSDDHHNNEQSNSSNNNSNNTNNQGFDVSLLINELNTLKANQMKITQELSRVRSDNELLWTELFSTREKNLLQNEKIEKILHFLASVYGNKVKVLEDHMNYGNGNNYIQNQPTYEQYQSPNSQPSPSAHQQQQQQQPQQQQQHHHHQQQLYNNPDELLQSPRFNKPRLMIKQTRHVSNPSSHSTPQTIPDDSPIQEIIRSPNFQAYQQQSPVQIPQQSPIPQHQQQPQQQQQHAPPPQQYNYLPSDDFQTQTIPDPQQVQPQQQQQQINTQQRPAVMTHQPSFEDLSKTIEAQGQSINDIISRIQQSQSGYPYDQNSSTISSGGGAPVGTPGFDFDEFLNQDVLLPEGEQSQQFEENDQEDEGHGNNKVGTIREIMDDENGKRSIDDDNNNNNNGTGEGDDGEEIEEIVNPRKKRRSQGRNTSGYR